jgi:hypothetical protein
MLDTKTAPPIDLEPDAGTQAVAAEAVEVVCSLRVTPGYTTFTGIVINKAHYRDIGADCNCAGIKLYRYVDSAFSRCDRHGFRALGYLVREYSYKVGRA